MSYTIEHARDALQHCDPGADRRQWIRTGAAFKAADGSYDDFLAWSASAPNFKGDRDVLTAWNSIKPGEVKAGTLYHEARARGWKPRQAGDDARPVHRAPAPAPRPVEPAKPPRWPVADVWETGEPATAAHPYVIRKNGTPEGLRICTQPVRIGGADMAGALLVPVRTLAGELVSVQCIPADGLKMNLHGHPMRGVHVVGELHPDGRAYLCEGIGQAWACWQATGHAAVVAFGWGRVRAVAGELLALHPGLRVVLVPDAGKEADAQAIAADAGCQWVQMPADAPANFDANDYAAEHGAEELAGLLEAAHAPAKPATPPASPRRPAGGMDARDGTDTTHPLTELGNARRLLDAHGDRLRYLPERKAWLLWEGDRWAVSDGAAVRALAAGLADVVYSEGQGFPADGVHFAKWARKCQDARTIAASAALLADVPALRLSAADLDADGMLCGLAGGSKALNLRTGTVRPAVRADYITKSLRADSIGDPARAVRWLQFVNEVTLGDAELADWLQRFLGYSLTGSTQAQFFVFLFGSGANGKSVLTEMVQHLLGDYAISIQPATLCDTDRKGGGASSDLARLDGVRFAVAPEAEEGSRFAESMLKALVGGDTMQVRELYCAPRDIKPVLKLALTGNHKPDIKGTDGGIWRRVRLVPFLASFEGRGDPHLSAKLRAEAPHILAWLVAGCVAWQARGLADTPRAIAAATEAYRDESDVLGQWLEERCTRGPAAEAPSSELYADFKEWSLAGGFARPWTSRIFGRKLGEYTAKGWAIGERKGTAGARLRTGIALRRPRFAPA